MFDCSPSLNEYILDGVWSGLAEDASSSLCLRFSAASLSNPSSDPFGFVS